MAGLRRGPPVDRPRRCPLNARKERERDVASYLSSKNEKRRGEIEGGGGRQGDGGRMSTSVFSNSNRRGSRP